MKYYLYNPKANNGIRPDFPNGAEIIEVIGLDFPTFFDHIKPEDEVVLAGGDGTLNFFINAMDGKEIKNNVYLLGAGTGNDFLNDINEKEKGKEVLINKYLTNLPTVHIKGKSYKFINGVGYGIDGYCCEEADRIKKIKPNKKISYTSIAIKGLLYKFKPRHVDVEMDGKKYSYDNVWLTPVMKGRFYGGGMMIAPNQDRMSDTLTIIIYHCKSKMKTLAAFPSLFKGEHIKKVKLIEVLTGKKCHVRFDVPCAAQIDGETVLEVQEYEAEIK